MTTVDALIEETQRPFINLDDQVPPPAQPLAEEWVEILDNAKHEFEVDGANAIFSTRMVEAEDPLDIGDIGIADGIYARTGQLSLDACMTDARAAQLLATLPLDDEHIMRIKILRESGEGDWVVEDKIDPVRVEGKRGRMSSRSLGTQSLGPDWD